jgi:hypothetical protein
LVRNVTSYGLADVTVEDLVWWGLGGVDAGL